MVLFFGPYDIIEIQLYKGLVVTFGSWLKKDDLFLELYLSEKSKSMEKPDYSFESSQKLHKITLPEEQLYLKLANEGDKIFNFEVNLSLKDKGNEKFMYDYDKKNDKSKIIIGVIIGIYSFLVLICFGFMYFDSDCCWITIYDVLTD